MGPSNRTPGQIVGAGIAGALIGAAGGAALGGSFDWPGAGLGALIGAVVIGVGEAVTDATRTPGTPKPLWWRIVTATMLAAVIGWLLEAAFGQDLLVLYGALVGGLYGALGARLAKFGLGLAVGIGLGVLFSIAFPDTHVPVLTAVVALVYRSLAAVIWRGRTQTQIMAEQVPADEVDYVVPFEARSRYVGSSYFEELARREGGTFARDPGDAGIVASLDLLDGPGFDASVVDPLIREFYEHTTRFHLTIIPEWVPWIRPGYLAYKTVVARPLGQANLPYNTREAQRGIVSHIDTISWQGSQDIDVRGWVRAFADSEEAIYVGIYTIVRHDDKAYVSVGFPLPSGNITATLQPHNLDGGGLLLETRTPDPWTGHYLTAFDDEAGELTVLKLLNFHEEIQVYVADGELKTDHRFYLGGARFLTLFYEIERA